MGDSLLVMDNNSKYVYMVIVKWMTVKKLDSAGLFQKIYKKNNNTDETENFPTTDLRSQDTLSPQPVVIVGDTAGL